HLSIAEPTADPVERARRFMAHMTMSFNGTNGYSFGPSAMGPKLRTQAKAPSMARRVDVTLRLVAQRLRNVEIENVDAFRLIDRYDRPQVTVYADPPYVMRTRTTSKGHAFDST